MGSEFSVFQLLLFSESDPSGKKIVTMCKVVFFFLATVVTLVVPPTVSRYGISGARRNSLTRTSLVLLLLVMCQKGPAKVESNLTVSR